MTEFMKAELAKNKKLSRLIRIAVVSTVSLLGLVLAAVSLFKADFLYAFAYLIAGALGVLYVAISINATFVQSVILDGDKLILNTWNNGFFPFDVYYKPRFFADFVPAKSVSYEIVINDIKELCVGSKGFLLKTADKDSVTEKLDKIIACDKSLDKHIKRYDILYVKMLDGRVYMMEVNDFDSESLYSIMDSLERKVQGLEFKTNVRLLRKRKDSSKI